MKSGAARRPATVMTHARACSRRRQATASARLVTAVIASAAPSADSRWNETVASQRMGKAISAATAP